MSDIVNTASRTAILEGIRQALGPRRATPMEGYARIERHYDQASSLDSGSCIELLVERLQHYEVGVFRCERATLPRTIGDAAVLRRKSRLVIPEGLPREWLPPTIQGVADTGLSHADLDRSEGVLTGCSVAVASTGTIVLYHGRSEGRRALTLVPDYHLCVVFRDQIVQTVPEAFRRLAESAPALVTTISGPSATADIEMTRIRGVHGPRTLDVILVNGDWAGDG